MCNHQDTMKTQFWEIDEAIKIAENSIKHYWNINIPINLVTKVKSSVECAFSFSIAFYMVIIHNRSNQSWYLVETSLFCENKR